MGTAIPVDPIGYADRSRILAGQQTGSRWRAYRAGGISVSEAQSQGNLEVRLQGQYQGDIARLKSALNQTGDQLKYVFDAISQSMQNLSKGEFSSRIDANLTGDFSVS